MLEVVREVYDEPVPCEVLHDDGRWYRGFLISIVEWPDGERRGEVEYSVAIGMKFTRSVERSKVRYLS